MSTFRHELRRKDRKTIRKYVRAAGVVPEYGPRLAQPSKLDAFKPYLDKRLRAGVWNARVLLRELRERNYAGGYTILTDWLRPQRSPAGVMAVRRFETAPGKQAQVDWGHLGTLEIAGQEQKLHGFTFTLGYSRRMVAEAALDQTDAFTSFPATAPAILTSTVVLFVFIFIISPLQASARRGSPVNSDSLNLR